MWYLLRKAAASMLETDRDRQKNIRLTMSPEQL